MKLHHLTERTIKVPNKATTRIYHGIVHAAVSYLRGTFRQGLYDMEDVLNMSLERLRTEFRNDIRFIEEGKMAVFMVPIPIEEIPYYHTSALVRKNLEKIETGEILIKCKVQFKEAGDSMFSPRSDVMLINARNLMSEMFAYLYHYEEAHKDAREGYAKGIKKELGDLEKTIEHEMMHVVQVYGLPSEQSEMLPDYKNVEDPTKRHDDYYSSPAEIKPYLTNMKQRFITTFVEDSFWKLFDRKQRGDAFKMFVGLKDDPMVVSINGEDYRISFEPTEFFSALKRKNPKQHRLAVRDFYNIVSEYL